ncbi:mediator complex subunit [Histoplasma capsulatum G186AR]|uniref:Mediator of RNA polymerase II transcription subunit 7 n=2 Tax=Ajellomyces capsulatus TaxID=5037 RepID=C0NS10_AJECG|nr:mediator complex subunit [Histoplasma capsulatum G186AR]EEH05676.1 mediator complex subunit [Histoplasma capsulatum G186AR]KAG5300169.1 mediator complex subunit [Histoplasma capsulatum]QSS67202.1 mediator complex subunit [Histoplasma capsulatum G186AR]
MAEAGQQKVTAAFPPPPPFWKHFTSQNLKKLDECKKEHEEKIGSKQIWTPEALRMLELPPELRFLVPPQAPTSSSYSLFGESQSVSINLPSLQEQGIEQLYPSPPSGNALPANHRFYLLKISKSLLLNFLEFIGILALCPERFESKVQDIRNLFINAHHLLNLYRPHQARESLIMLMEEQLDRTKEEIKEMDRIKVNVEGFLKQLEAEGSNIAGASSAKSGPSLKQPDFTAQEEDAIEEARSIWNLLDQIDED